MISIGHGPVRIKRTTEHAGRLRRPFKYLSPECWHYCFDRGQEESMTGMVMKAIVSEDKNPKQGETETLGTRQLSRIVGDKQCPGVNIVSNPAPPARYHNPKTLVLENMKATRRDIIS